MKFPKNRANIYIVVRGNYDGNQVSILGAFADLVEADNYKDACAAEWFDKVKGKDTTSFDVMITTFYK